MIAPGEPSRPRLPPLTWTLGIVGLAFALLLFGGGTLYLQQAAELRLLRQELQLAAVERRTVEVELDAERIITRRELAQLRDAQSRVRALEGATSAGPLHISLLELPDQPERDELGAVVWSVGTRHGVLILHAAAAALPAGDYQLWLGGRPVPGARFVLPDGPRPTRFHLSADEVLRPGDSDGFQVQQVEGAIRLRARN
jgi:hypothetical protein